MTRKGGTSQACASCKYQRRRCKVDCPLAPYFPADQPNMFQNAHRLFGVSNIIKILKQIDPSQRGVAMKSIIDQANARAKYPVYGCVAEIQQLMLKIQLAEEELQAVQAQLAFYRQHNQQQQQEISSTATDSVLPLQLGTLPPPLPISPPTNANGFSLFHQDPPPQYCNSAAAAFPVSHPSSYSNAAYNTSNAPYVNSCSPPLCSSESSLKDIAQSVEHVSENELKSAAACFSLTSVNL